MAVQPFREEVICKFAGLLESTDAFGDFEVDPSIIGKFSEIVVINKPVV